MTSKKWSDEELIEFVQLYRKEECLWNIKSPNFRDRTARFTALQNICAAMNCGLRASIECFTVDDVKSKIKSLRCTYYLECDKINKSINSGGNVYIPKMKWFSVFHEFIKEQTIKRRTKENYTNEYEDLLELTLQPKLEQPPQSGDNRPAENYNQPPRNNQKEQQKRSHIVPPKKRKISQIASIVAEMKKANQVNDKEDIDIFGLSVAAQMKKLSEEQAVIAQDEIQSILTRCRLTDLRMRSFDQFTSQYVQLPQSSPSDTSVASSSVDLYPDDTRMSSSEAEPQIKEEEIYYELPLTNKHST